MKVHSMIYFTWYRVDKDDAVLGADPNGVLIGRYRIVLRGRLTP